MVGKTGEQIVALHHRARYDAGIRGAGQHRRRGIVVALEHEQPGQQQVAVGAGSVLRDGDAGEALCAFEVAEFGSVPRGAGVERAVAHSKRGKAVEGGEGTASVAYQSGGFHDEQMRFGALGPQRDGTFGVDEGTGRAAERQQRVRTKATGVGIVGRCRQRPVR